MKGGRHEAGVVELDRLVEVVVETPVPLRAHITRSALTSLGLRPLSPVQLLLEAMAIVVDPL